MTCEDLGPYRKAGRPQTTVCRRGHRKPPGKCVKCHRMMDQVRYHANAAVKKEYMRVWRSDFKFAYGIAYGTINSNGLKKSDLNRRLP
jgi:hypothetical protein